jgi:putative phosphoesterase
MSTILALSDTHLNGHLPDGTYYPEQLIDLIEKADLVLHAGDFVSQDAYNNLVGLCGDKLWAIQGNSNPIIRDSNYQPLKKQTADMVLGIKIGLMHEDANIGYDFSETYAADRAASMVSDDTKFVGVDVLVFGHLHEPIIVWNKNPEGKRRLLICPGPGSNNVFALCHKCSPAPTVALLDIIAGNISGAEIIRISWPK